MCTRKPRMEKNSAKTWNNLDCPKNSLNTFCLIISSRLPWFGKNDFAAQVFYRFISRIDVNYKLNVCTVTFVVLFLFCFNKYSFATIFCFYFWSITIIKSRWSCFVVNNIIFCWVNLERLLLPSNGFICKMSNFLTSCRTKTRYETHASTKKYLDKQNKHFRKWFFWSWTTISCEIFWANCT